MATHTHLHNAFAARASTLLPTVTPFLLVGYSTQRYVALNTLHSYAVTIITKAPQQLVIMDFPHAHVQASIAARVYLTAGVPSLYGQPATAPIKHNATNSGEGAVKQRSLKTSRSIRNLGSFFGRGRSRSSAGGSSTQLASIAGADHDDDDTSLTTEHCHEPVMLEDGTEVHERIGEGETAQQTHFKDQGRDERHQGLLGRQYPGQVGHYDQGQAEQHHQGHTERHYQCLSGRQHPGRVQQPQESLLDGSTTVDGSTSECSITIDGASIFEADFDVANALKYLNMHEEQQSTPPTPTPKPKLKPSSGGFSRHQRNESLHVTLSSTELVRLAKELYDQTIAEVHLSLLIYWINESTENYNLARDHIRELKCDRGYKISRVGNLALRQLLTQTEASRPTEPREVLTEEDQRAEVAAGPVVVAGTRPVRKRPVLPRIDTLPPALRSLREQGSQAALRSASLAPVASSSVWGTYPPDTPDRPLPLVPTPRSVSSGLRSPSSTLLSPFPPSNPPSLPPPLPFGFPSPGSPVRDINDNMSALDEYNCSSETDSVESNDFRARVASMYERIVALEGPEQIDAAMEELRALKDLYVDRQI